MHPSHRPPRTRTRPSSPEKEKEKEKAEKRTYFARHTPLGTRHPASRPHPLPSGEGSPPQRRGGVHRG
jgi:hypothetical protein